MYSIGVRKGHYCFFLEFVADTTYFHYYFAYLQPDKYPNICCCYPNDPVLVSPNLLQMSVDPGFQMNILFNLRGRFLSSLCPTYLFIYYSSNSRLLLVLYPFSLSLYYPTGIELTLNITLPQNTRTNTLIH